MRASAVISATALSHQRNTMPGTVVPLHLSLTNCVITTRLTTLPVS